MFLRFWRWLTGKSEPTNRPVVVATQPTEGQVEASTPAKPVWGALVPQARMDIQRADEIARVCSIILKNKGRYETIQAVTKIPWWFIAALHYRESSLSFAGVLHNGERILGTGKKTKLVPKGRGPFDSWEEAAIDALVMKGYNLVSNWSLAKACELAEKFNGLGYRKTSEYSPYVLAGTNLHDETGKYVADGKYSSTAPEKQLGVLAIWLGLGLTE